MIDFEEQIEEQRQKSIARREAHPDWPAHVTTLDTSEVPTKEEIQKISPIFKILVDKQDENNVRFRHISETLPIGKSEHRGYCKYCYTTHSNWWLMDQADYHMILNQGAAPTADETVLLCEYCTHTSQKQFTEIEPIPPKPTLSRLEQIIRRHTTTESKHQNAALRMLRENNFKRYDAEIKSITCYKCGSAIEDCVRWTDRETGNITDSWGYMELNEGDECYRCCDSGSFVGDIFLPSKKST